MRRETPQNKECIRYIIGGQVDGPSTVHMLNITYIDKYMEQPHKDPIVIFGAYLDQ